MTTALSLDWWERAACQAEDPDLFFPVSDTGPGRRQTVRAKAICAQCDVRLRCLDYALATEQEHGVWGGMSEVERRAALRSGRVSELPRWPRHPAADSPPRRAVHAAERHLV
jgi:WhiB family transcriptional regulator, redox-sensing transcriptional regulator